MTDMPGWGSAVMKTYKDDLAAALARAKRLEAKVSELEGELLRAKSALRRAGFEDRGGEAWVPPVNHAFRQQWLRMEQQAATIERLKGLLKAVEWIEADGERSCPFCFTFENFGRHQTACPLDAALNAMEPA